MQNYLPFPKASGTESWNQPFTEKEWKDPPLNTGEKRSTGLEKVYPHVV